MSATTKELLEKYKEIASMYGSKESSFEWWEAHAGDPRLGVDFIDTRTKKARFRISDDTPSVAFYPNLTYVDYGGEGRKRDVIDRLKEVNGYSTREALEAFFDIHGYAVPSTKTEDDRSKRRSGEEKKPPYSANVLRKMIENRKDNRYKDRYQKLVKGLLRACTDEEIKVAEKVLHIGFSPKGKFEKEDRVFLPEFNQDKIAYSAYRYNRKSSVKGLLRRNGQRSLFGSHLLGKFPQTIVFAEGHTDCANLIAKGIACVTTGSSTTPIGEHIGLLAGRNLMFFPDLDIPGMIGVAKKIKEIEEWNLKADENQKIRYMVFWWHEWFYSEKLAQKTRRLTKADKGLFELAKAGKIPIKNGAALLNRSILQYIQNVRQQNVPEGAKISNWKVVLKKESRARKEGYDFVDFLLENGGRPPSFVVERCSWL